MSRIEEAEAEEGRCREIGAHIRWSLIGGSLMTHEFLEKHGLTVL